MEKEISVRSLSHSISSYNVRVAKLSRIQAKVRSKEGGMVSLRNSLKLYQNYKAMESCAEALLTSIDNVRSRCSIGEGGAGEDVFVGRVNGEYLLLARYSDGSVRDYFHNASSNAAPVRTHDPDHISRFCTISNNLKQQYDEYRTKQPVLALYPNTNRMLPAQVSSPPSRRRKTLDYLVKFPSDSHSVPCPPQFVIDPNNLVL